MAEVEDKIIERARQDMQEFHDAVARLGSKRVEEEEWPYFEENARRFDLNELDKRYGILPMGAEPRDENMIYADCPRKLRLKHLKHIDQYGGSPGEQVRKHLDWLERMEGKQ